MTGRLHAGLHEKSGGEHYLSKLSFHTAIFLRVPGCLGSTSTLYEVICVIALLQKVKSRYP